MDSAGKPRITCKLDTRRARTEVTAMQAQATSLRDLAGPASNDADADWLIGRTLFNLLVPAELDGTEAGAIARLRELEARVPAPWRWESVYDETRPVLEPYAQMARGAEQRAARRLLDVLQWMATG